MAKKDLRQVSREGWWMGPDGPSDAEIQSGSQQRIADALERSATAHETMAASGKRTAELHELHLKPKIELEDANRKLRESNILFQDELKKACRERGEFKNKVNIQRDGVKHLYRRIAALKGVITKLKKAR